MSRRMPCLMEIVGSSPERKLMRSGAHRCRARTHSFQAQTVRQMLAVSFRIHLGQTERRQVAVADLTFREHGLVVWKLFS